MEAFLDYPDNLGVIPFALGDCIGYVRMLWFVENELS